MSGSVGSTRSRRSSPSSRARTRPVLPAGSSCSRPSFVPSAAPKAFGVELGEGLVAPSDARALECKSKERALVGGRDAAFLLVDHQLQPALNEPGDTAQSNLAAA